MLSECSLHGISGGIVVNPLTPSLDSWETRPSVPNGDSPPLSPSDEVSDVQVGGIPKRDTPSTLKVTWQISY